MDLSMAQGLPRIRMARELVNSWLLFKVTGHLPSLKLGVDLVDLHLARETWSTVHHGKKETTGQQTNPQQLHGTGK